MYEFESRSGHNKIASKSGLKGLDKYPVVKTVVSFKEYLAREMMLKPYKKPSIVRPADGDWFIQFYYRHPDQPSKFKAHRIRAGINYIKDISEKEDAAKLLLGIVHDWLKEGNLPSDSVQEAKAEIKVVKEKIKLEKSKWSMLVAIDEFMNYHRQQNKEKRTLATYQNYTKVFSGYLKEYHLSEEPAHQFTENELLKFLKYGRDKLKWAPRTYNNYLKFYIGFFQRIFKLERRLNRKIVYDFFPDELEPLSDKAQRNKAYSRQLLDAIKAEAEKNKFFDLRDYLEWIGLSMMRPAEIRDLRFMDIDLENRQIRIIGKTGDRLVPISDQLLNLINKRSQASNSFHDFVFGMAGKVSPDRMGVMFFLDQFAIIRKKIKLPTAYTIYSMKPTAVLMMIKAGFSDEEIKKLTGHKTQAAFEAYKRDLIIDDAHLMKGQTINFWDED